MSAGRTRTPRLNAARGIKTATRAELRRLAELRGWTMADLALRAGVDNPAAAFQRLDVVDIKAFCDALGVRVSAVIADVERIEATR